MTEPQPVAAVQAETAPPDSDERAAAPPAGGGLSGPFQPLRIGGGPGRVWRVRGAQRRLYRERDRAQRLWLSKQAELEDIASRDDLTQLQNRRFFYDHLREELAQAASHRKALSIVMIG